MPTSRKRLHITDQVDIARPYTDEEEEFLKAVRAWMEKVGRKFPAFTEIREIAIKVYKKRRRQRKPH